MTWSVLFVSTESCKTNLVDDFSYAVMIDYVKLDAKWAILELNVVFPEFNCLYITV